MAVTVFERMENAKFVSFFFSEMPLGIPPEILAGIATEIYTDLFCRLPALASLGIASEIFPAIFPKFAPGISPRIVFEDFFKNTSWNPSENLRNPFRSSL